MAATLHKILQGHTNIVYSVAFSPDSKFLASASGDNTVRLWNIANGDLHGELKGHTNRVSSVAFSPDGKSIVTGSFDNTVRTWSVATKQQVQILNGHSISVNSVAWSPNGDVIASGSYDKTVILWDAISGSVKDKLTGYEYYVMSVLFSQNGNKLASAGYVDNTVIIWDVNSGAALIKLAHSKPVSSVCFSHDDQFVVTGCYDNIVRMFDANNGREEKRFEGHTDSVNSVAFSFDGSIIASCSDDKSVRLWDVASTKQLQQLDGYANQVYSVAFSRDGKFIALGSWDKTVRLWNAPSSLQRHILPKPVSPRFCAALYDFAGTEKGKLSFQQNSILSIDGRDENGWAQAKLLPAGASGLIPLNYVEIISEEEAQRRLQQQKQNAAEIEKQKKQQEIEKQQKAAAELEKQKKELLAKQQETQKQQAIEKQQKAAAELEKKEKELLAKQQEIERQQKEFERQKAEQQKRQQEIADREHKQREELEKQKKQEEEEAKKAQVNLDPNQVAEWSVDDVCGYFKQVKIDDDVITIFRKQKVKGRLLSQYTKEDKLKSIGIEADGDREDVISAINKLVSPSRGANTGLKVHEIPRRELIKDTKLSEGKFGIVWRGTYNGIPVAIKEPILYGDADFNAAKQLADLIEEATVMTSISVHPNVLHCYGISRVGEDDCLLVIELCNLGSLDSFLRTYPGTPAVDRRRFSQQVARGLNHLGKYNIAHRDVAARNVLLHDQGGVIVAKVCDFGLSRQREGEYYMVTGQHLLSPETAPEVFTTGKHSSRSDVWSFGVLLWEVESLCATRANPNKVAFPPLSKPAQASDNMYAVMLKCWAKDPHQRPSFEALVDLLA